MTSTITVPAPVAATRGRRSSTDAWLGGLFALLGVVIVVGAAAVLVLFGSDSTLSSDSQALSTRTAALVSGTAEISDTAEVADVLGDPRIKISAESDGENGVFVGIGPAEAVDRYLANAPVAEVTDLDFAPFRLDRRMRDGIVTPASPAAQDFWVASSSSDRKASIDWKVRDGEYRAVVMNADGSVDVASHGTFGVTIPHLSAFALGVLIAGLLVIAGGIATLVIGRRGRTR